MFESADPGTTWMVVGGLITAGAVVARRHAREAHVATKHVPVRSTGRATPLVVSMGTDEDGDPQTLELSECPHLLVAGMTGAGKSVLVTSMLRDLVTTYSPDQLRLVLLDPKRVELAAFRDAPHTISFEYELRDMIGRLEWLELEMQARYEQLQAVGKRKIDETLGIPRIVVVIDELANLMLTPARRVVEGSIVRLASMGRAAGIHLVLVTQRPSVDVVTGVIKANVPARVCLAVATSIDSRVVLDRTGGQDLRGRGDLLLHRTGARDLVRCQGPMVTDREIRKAVTRWR